MKAVVTGMAFGLAFVLVLWRLDHVEADLVRECAARRAAVQECDQWRATAEAYRQEALAQAENARQCLNREQEAAQDAKERAAIVKQARPRTRTAAEKERVVDDETRRRAVYRLNRPL